MPIDGNSLGRAYGKGIRGLGMVGGVIFGLMAFFIGVDVILRNAAGSGIGWIIELMEYAMFVATALAAPWVLREGAHVSVDVVTSQLPAPTARGVALIADASGALICGTLVFYSAKATWLAYERGSMIVKSFVFPEWWVNALVPFGMLLMTVEFLLLLRRHWGSQPLATAG